jgi:hypothetical protein
MVPVERKSKAVPALSEDLRRLGREWFGELDQGWDFEYEDASMVLKPSAGRRNLVVRRRNDGPV